jgi:hypothetical protein
MNANYIQWTDGSIVGNLTTLYQLQWLFSVNLYKSMGARGSIVGSGTMLQAGRSRVRVLMRWIFQCT